MDNREEKRGEGEFSNKSREESGEIGGLTTPTYPPKPQFLFSIVFKTVFLITLIQTHNFNLTSITT